MPNFISSTASKIALFLLFSCGISQAQVVGDNHTKYTRADTLRGSLRPERINYDALKYHLKLKVEPDKKFISGSNVISFEVLKDMPVMQLDLFRNMEIDSVIFQDQSLEYEREYNAVFLSFPEPLKIGVKDSLEFFYHGQPVIAKNAPWDGGFVWTQDEDGNPWVGVAVQGTGASLWYPNKDHQSDEPDSAQLDIAVPNGLMNVSNGRFIGKTDLGNGFTEWRWKVVNPINNYDVMINIGNYEHFSDTFQDLDLDYYVLPYNLEKAKKTICRSKRYDGLLLRKKWDRTRSKKTAINWWKCPTWEWSTKVLWPTEIITRWVIWGAIFPEPASA